MIFAKNTISIFLLSLLLSSNVLTAQDNKSVEEKRAKNTWDKVADLYKPSLYSDQQPSTDNKDYQMVTITPDLLKTPEQKQTINKIKNTYTYKEKKTSEQLQENLTASFNNNLRHLDALLNHLASNTKNLHDESQSVFDDTTYQDLSVFCGDKKNGAASFFNIIDQTQTIAGRLALLDILYNPLTDIQELIKRQNALQKLVIDKKLSTSIKEKLTAIKNAEHIFFTLLDIHEYYSDDEELITGGDAISQYANNAYVRNIFQFGRISNYFMKKILPLLIEHLPFVPKDPIYQKTVCKIASAGLLSSINAAITHIPFIKKFEKNLTEKINKRPTIIEINNYYKYLEQFVLIPNETITSYTETGKDLFTVLKNKKANSSKLPLILGGLNLLYAPFNVYEYYKKFPKLLDEETVNNKLHDAIGAFAKMVIALKELRDIVYQHPELTAVITFNDFEQNATPELKKFMTLMNDEIFSKPATAKTPKGKMLVAFKYLATLKYEFIQPYIQAGTIDALMSTATLYKNLENNPNARYHFANYEHQATPHLAINDCWNPFISPKTVVTNSLELGTCTLGSKTTHRNMLITGPNAGGKSTTLKAIAFAVLMAQTLTIANGDVTLTPFTKIFTTLNITDTVGTESLFQAEKNRIKNVITVISTIKPEEFALLISDEMFNSTGASHGSALFAGTLSFIDQYAKNTLFAAATHFESLVDLEKDTQGSTANFRVEEASVNQDGKMQWTYKIKPGINKQNISFELAQEDGFDPRLLQAGLAFMERHKQSKPLTLPFL